MSTDSVIPAIGIGKDGGTGVTRQDGFDGQGQCFRQDAG